MVTPGTEGRKEGGEPNGIVAETRRTNTIVLSLSQIEYKTGKREGDQERAREREGVQFVPIHTFVSTHSFHFIHIIHSLIHGKRVFYGIFI